MDWQTLRNQFMRDIGGDPPGNHLEDTLIAAYTDHPDAIERSIEKITLAFKAGKIRSPWGALKTEAEKAVDAARNPTHNAGSSKTKALARAEQWVRTAGLHYDRETELIDELFGHGGLLERHDTQPNRDRILTLWQELRPAGELVEHEAIERGQRYQETRASLAKIPSAPTPGNLTVEELKALAARKSQPVTQVVEANP